MSERKCEGFFLGLGLGGLLDGGLVGGHGWMGLGMGMGDAGERACRYVLLDNA
ncbi:hypothetical protein EJ04DRAFT_512288 [Polyplosphaeria fusca]|uniref:Uncharacterized protein n=1 Tax=Polyplosphaeria fusca TaxID=682080 RepID=A0A9P4V2X3_9PLEO|nr:hypothetical protein EJ04DRAFT_512288 [Polyplosphaeria fusca]